MRGLSRPFKGPSGPFGREKSAIDLKRASCTLFVILAISPSNFYTQYINVFLQICCKNINHIFYVFVFTIPIRTQRIHFISGSFRDHILFYNLFLGWGKGYLRLLHFFPLLYDVSILV